MSTFQALKYGRCNSNVCEASRKLTRLNYVRLWVKLPEMPADSSRPGLVPMPRVLVNCPLLRAATGVVFQKSRT